MTAHAVGRPCRCVQHWCAICGTELEPATWTQHVCEPTGPRCGGVLTERNITADPVVVRVLPKPAPVVHPKPAPHWLERLVAWWRRPWP